MVEEGLYRIIRGGFFFFFHLLNIIFLEAKVFVPIFFFSIPPSTSSFCQAFMAPAGLPPRLGSNGRRTSAGSSSSYLSPSSSSSSSSSFSSSFFSSSSSSPFSSIRSPLVHPHLLLLSPLGQCTCLCSMSSDQQHNNNVFSDVPSFSPVLFSSPPPPDSSSPPSSPSSSSYRGSLGDVSYHYRSPGHVRHKQNFCVLQKKLRITEDLQFHWTKQMGRCRRTGKITVRHRGGGIKEPYKMIDWWFFNYGKTTTNAIILEIVPRKWKAFPIALVMFVNALNTFSYRYILLATKSLRPGDFVNVGEDAFFKEGNSKPLHSLPLNTTVYNLEVKKGHGAAIARSSRNYAKVLQKINEENKVVMRLPSGKLKTIDGDCYATVGSSHPNVVMPPKGKAGVNRNLGRRPGVRGVAMNAVDHPHGGGTGKSGIGRVNALTPWGKYFRGMKDFGKDFGRGPTRGNREKLQRIKRANKLAAEQGRSSLGAATTTVPKKRK
eukprot:GHVS01032399.1.p1 GENE.GHVS01032399.1~~GHVS01032399.1.p1  ORF type:complete len:490 (-),score=124.51 GHVS01032399.1:567-2036(-)